MAKGFWKGLIEKLWAIDSTQYPEKQFESMRELLKNENVNVTAHDLQELVRKLRLKHWVDEISIANYNGSLIVSSQPANALKQAISSAAMFSYVSSEILDSKMLFVKSDHWLMIFPFNKKLFMVRANASLTEIELKALANDIEKFLEMGFLEQAADSEVSFKVQAEPPAEVSPKV